MRRYPSSRIKQALPLAAVALASVLVVGCGGSADSAAPPPVTKAAFVKKADLICRKADAMQHDELDAYQAKHRKALARLSLVPHEEAIVKALTLPSVKGELAEIESLALPDGEKRKVEAILAGWNEAIRKGERNPYSVAAWWAPAKKEPFHRINEIAVRYGFNDCGDLR